MSGPPLDDQAQIKYVLLYQSINICNRIMQEITSNLKHV